MSTYVVFFTLPETSVMAGRHNKIAKRRSKMWRVRRENDARAPPVSGQWRLWRHAVFSLLCLRRSGVTGLQQYFHRMERI